MEAGRLISALLLSALGLALAGGSALLVGHVQRARSGAWTHVVGLIGLALAGVLPFLWVASFGGR